MNRLYYTSEESDAGVRADRWLASAAEGLLTRSAIQKLCDCKAVRVGEKPVSKNDRLRGGETFIIDVPDAQPLDIVPQDIPIEIEYEDGDLLEIGRAHV